MKKIFLIVAFSFGIYFTSCNKKVKTSTEVKLAIEKVFQENLLSFDKYNKCPCGSQKDFISQNQLKSLK